MASVNASNNSGVKYPVAVNVEKDDTFTVTFGKSAPVQAIPVTSPLANDRVEASAKLSAAAANREAKTAVSAVKKADEEIKRAEAAVEQAREEATRLSQEASSAKAALKTQVKQTTSLVGPTLKVSNTSNQNAAKQKLLQAQKAGEEARKVAAVASEKAAEAVTILRAASEKAARARAARAAMATSKNTAKAAKVKTAKTSANEVRRLLVDSSDRANRASAAAGEAEEKAKATRAKSGLLPGTTSTSASHNGIQPGTKITPTGKVTSTVSASDLAASTQANEAAIAADNLLKLQKKAEANPSDRKAADAVAQATPQVKEQIKKAQNAQGGHGNFAGMLGNLLLFLSMFARGGGKRTRTHKRTHKRNHKRTHTR